MPAVYELIEGEPYAVTVRPGSSVAVAALPTDLVEIDFADGRTTPMKLLLPADVAMNLLERIRNTMQELGFWRLINDPERISWSVQSDHAVLQYQELELVFARESVDALITSAQTVRTKMDTVDDDGKETFTVPAKVVQQD